MTEQNISNNCSFNIITLDEIKYLPNLNSNRKTELINRLEDMEYEDILNIDFTHSVKDSNKTYYEIAAISGLLTSLLDIFLSSTLTPEKIKIQGSQRFNEYVIKQANRIKSKMTPKDKRHLLKEMDLAKSIEFLENMFPSAGDSVTDSYGGSTQHHLREFSHHPTIVGLIASILSQFTGNAYGTDTDGKSFKFALDETVLNDNTRIFKEPWKKILFGIMNWSMHLISDMAGSSNTPGFGTGIPGPMLSLFKELSASPIFNKQTVKYNGADIPISQFLSKIFNGTIFKNPDGSIMKDSNGKRIGFDFRFESELVRINSIPVLINECLTRLEYTLVQLKQQLKNSNIKDLKDLDWKSLLPFKNRTVTRMLTISNLTFTALSTAGAAAVSAVKSKGNGVAFVSNFLVSVNINGIGRCLFACAADSKYLAEDMSKIIKDFRQRLQESKTIHSNLAFNVLSFNRVRILYSLMLHMVETDIITTKGSHKQQLKSEWLTSWKEFISDSLDMEEKEIFMPSDNAYASITYEIASSDNNNWIYILANELFSFVPYHELFKNQKKQNLRFSLDPYKFIFCKNQSAIDLETLNKMIAYTQENDVNLKSSLPEANRIYKIIAGPTQIIPAATDMIISAITTENPFNTTTISDSIFMTDSEHTRHECSKILSVCNVILDKDPSQMNYAELLSKELHLINEEMSLKTNNMDVIGDKDQTKDFQKTRKYLVKTESLLNKVIKKYTK